MDSIEMFNKILNLTASISESWKTNNLSSKKVRKQVENNFFHNNNADFASKFAYFYALDTRINTRYNNFLKILFRFFSWKKETKLLLKIKRFLNCFDSINSKTIILQKIDNFLSGENCFDAGENTNGKQHKQKIRNKIKPKQNKNLDNKIQAIAKNDDITNEKDEPKSKEKAEQNLNENDAELLDKEDKGISEKLNILDDKSFALNNAVKQTDVSFINKTSVREKIEIPKQDLISEQKFNVKKNNQKTNHESLGNKPIGKQNDVKNLTEINDCEFLITENNRQKIDEKTNKIEPYFQQQDSIEKYKTERNDGNCFSKTDKINHFFEKNLQEVRVSDKSYEQQKNEILTENISKLSEKDVQQIKDLCKNN